jgi:hypothetical protein
MKNFINDCRTITEDSQGVVEKSFFDENYGFRHIPVLFKNSFQYWNHPSSGDSTFLKPSYFECWYEKYASESAPQKGAINLNKIEDLTYFKKNIWDLSSWHYLKEGEVTWFFYPPAVVEYLQLSGEVPEALSERGLYIDVLEVATKYKVKPLKITQTKGELLFIPPMYAYSNEINVDANLISNTILTEYNHDNLYAYFRKSECRVQIKQVILDGFTNTKHLSVYETPMQRLSNQAAA